jgi:tetratricopeptide (TPR) repeat protein
MRSIVGLTVVSCVLGLSMAAFAAGGGGGESMSNIAPSKPADPNFGQAKALIEARNYAPALPLLQQVVAKDPRNADAFNLLGLPPASRAIRKGSLQYYNQALTLDPKHIGAHEYAGEAYLMLDRLPEAEQHLARLDSLCVFGCTEYGC